MLYKDVNRNNGIKLNKESLDWISESILWQQSKLAWPTAEFLKWSNRSPCILEQHKKLDKTLENLPYEGILLCWGEIVIIKVFAKFNFSESSNILQGVENVI